MSTPLTDGQVTLADLFRVLSSIQQDQGKSLIRLEGIDVTLKAAQNATVDHETRLRNLEAAAIRVKTIASTIGATAGIVTGIIATIVSHAH
jgi:uncharacterized protein (UPF0254 family)